MKPVSVFIRRMNELLKQREAAQTDEDRLQAEREMTDLIRSLSVARDERDYKAAQSGERTD